MMEYHISEYIWKKIFNFLKNCSQISVLVENETRLFIEAIWFVARSGCQWRLLPRKLLEEVVVDFLQKSTHSLMVLAIHLISFLRLAKEMTLHKLKIWFIIFTIQLSLSYDKHIYKERHLIECFFGKIKYFRRIFSRFDKTVSSYLGFLQFVWRVDRRNFPANPSQNRA